jgi:hypothetical protein
MEEKTGTFLKKIRLLIILATFFGCDNPFSTEENNNGTIILKSQATTGIINIALQEVEFRSDGTKQMI